MSRSSSARPRSIRLQIDLPMEEEAPMTPSSFCVQINIDKKGRYSAKNMMKKRTSHIDSTSGYSSTSGLSSSSSTNSLNSFSSGADQLDTAMNSSDEFTKHAALKDDNVSQQPTKTSLSKSNCYDKLSYVPVQSTKNVPDRGTMVEKKQSNANNNTHVTSENIYEDISSYLESIGHLYVNQPNIVRIIFF